MAKPIVYVTELTDSEALDFIKAEKRELSEAAKKLLKAAEKIPLNVQDLFKK